MTRIIIFAHFLVKNKEINREKNENLSTVTRRPFHSKNLLLKKYEIEQGLKVVQFLSLVFVINNMLSTLEDADLHELTSSNQLLINYANDLRLGLQTKPSQSNFRVLCILGKNHSKKYSVI
jgi:hypothetical protein